MMKSVIKIRNEEFHVRRQISIVWRELVDFESDLCCKEVTRLSTVLLTKPSGKRKHENLKIFRVIRNFLFIKDDFVFI